MRCERVELDDVLRRLFREGNALRSVVPDDDGDAYTIRYERRTEIRDGV